MLFTQDRERVAISTAIVAAVAIAILVVAVGAYFLLSPAPASQSSTSTTSSMATSTTPIASSTSTTTSSSTSTTTTTSTSTTSSSAAAAFGFNLSVQPGNILLSPGSSFFYPTLTITPASTSATTGESVSLNSTVPTGITLSFDSNPAKVNPNTPRSVAMTFNVAQSVAPGNYTVTVGAKSGSISQVTTFTIHVVQYLVLEQGNAFVPSSLTVKVGTTVWWINLDMPGGGDPEIHNVVFTSGTTAQSPNMSEGSTYSYTFTTPGTYNYYCLYHPSSMQATITVTP